MTRSSFRDTLSIAVFTLFAAGCGSSGPRPKATADHGVVSGADVAKESSEPIERILQKKVPGLLVTRAPDGSIALNIRGRGEAPLYVIDDMPVDPGPGGALSGLDPYNIESIKVLKGGEASLYGIRAMNGVIVVKTKKPTPKR